MIEIDIKTNKSHMEYFLDLKSKKINVFTINTTSKNQPMPFDATSCQTY